MAVTARPSPYITSHRTATPAAATAVTMNPPWLLPQSIVEESVGGLIRRSPGAARARSEVLAPGNFEWPRIDDRLLGRRQRWGYVQSAREKRFFWNAVARVDFEGGNVERLDFGDRVFTSEPVFVPAAGW